MKNRVVILAAGKGKRMGKAEMPKVLVALKNKPLILYILEELEKLNALFKPVIVVGYKSEKVKQILGDDFVYAFQDKQLGTAHAVEASKNKVKAENVLALYGDMPFIKASSLKKLINLHHKKKSKISMFTAKVPNFSGKFGSLNGYGRILRNSAGKIVEIVEFKDANERQRKNKEVNPGIYVFNSDWLWKNIKKISNHNVQKEYYLTDLIKIAFEEQENISNLQIDPKEVLGVNTPQDLAWAEKVLK